MLKKIQIYYFIIKTSFALLFWSLKNHEFLYYEEGATKKFKLFGKQYIKQERYQKSGRDPKSKTVTYITSLSKAFAPPEEDQSENFKNLLKYTFLWYIFKENFTFEQNTEENNADSEQQNGGRES